MLPVKSNTADPGCTPVSSNCVVWQGPNIPCINLCTGDTVSTVVYKVATDLCTIKSSLDLTNLDLSCLVEFCTTVGPAPSTKTLSAVLDFIVKKVCCLNDLVEAGGGGTGGGTGTQEAPLPLPVCLQYTANGVNVVQLEHRDYSLHLGARFCLLKTTVDAMSSHETRITALENKPAITLAQVTPNCILPSVPTAMSTVLDELEAQYCLLRSVLGNNGQITAAAAQVCVGLNNANALSQPGTMSGYTGWNITVSNLAQSFQNLWITVCDLRNAMASLKNCCGQSKCGDFILGCDVSTNNDRTIVTFDFNPFTVIPSGYTDAPGGSTIVISDGTNSRNVIINNLVSLAGTGVFSTTVAGTGVVGTALNPALPYTITITGNIIKDGSTCTSTLGKTVSVPCTLIESVTATLVP